MALVADPPGEGLAVPPSLGTHTKAPSSHAPPRQGRPTGFSRSRRSRLKSRLAGPKFDGPRPRAGVRRADQQGQARLARSPIVPEELEIHPEFRQLIELYPVLSPRAFRPKLDRKRGMRIGRMQGAAERKHRSMPGDFVGARCGFFVRRALLHAAPSAASLGGPRRACFEAARAMRMCRRPLVLKPYPPAAPHGDVSESMHFPNGLLGTAPCSRNGAGPEPSAAAPRILRLMAAHVARTTRPADRLQFRSPRSTRAVPSMRRRKPVDGSRETRVEVKSVAPPRLLMWAKNRLACSECAHPVFLPFPVLADFKKGENPIHTLAHFGRM